MELPTKDDFNFYDVDGDGTLTLNEWEETESKAMEEVDLIVADDWQIADLIKEIAITFLILYVKRLLPIFMPFWCIEFNYLVVLLWARNKHFVLHSVIIAIMNFWSWYSKELFVNYLIFGIPIQIEIHNWNLQLLRYK